MTILLTGGTGRTSLAIAQRLHASDVAFRILSRSGSAPAPYQGCRFDWTDTSTWNAAFEQAVNVDAVYLVVPVIEHVETGEPIKAYIDFLKSKGVERFVLLSASNVAPGTRIMGLIHQHLRSIQADYVVLRPTWYMDNFSRNQAASIKSDGKIYSGAQDGKIPWISCDDVGAVGFCALTGTSKAAGKLVDPILLGPELLSYDDVAGILSDVLGRSIAHVRLSPEQYKGALVSAGLSEGWTQVMVEIEQEAAQNVEARLNDEVKRITGQAPTTFRVWAEQNKSVWM